MTAGIILDKNVSYFFHIAPGTYATGTISNWIDDPTLGRTYEITDYAWLSRAGRMSLIAAKCESGNYDGMLVEYVGGPPTRIGAHDIIRATPIAKPILVSVGVGNQK